MKLHINATLNRVQPYSPTWIRHRLHLYSGGLDCHTGKEPGANNFEHETAPSLYRLRIFLWRVRMLTSRKKVNGGWPRTWGSQDCSILSVGQHQRLIKGYKLWYTHLQRSFTSWKGREPGFSSISCSNRWMTQRRQYLSLVSNFAFFLKKNSTSGDKTSPETLTKGRSFSSVGSRKGHEPTCH